MELKTIIIAILIGYMIFWYINPEKATGYIDQGVNKTQTLVGNLNLNLPTICPTIYDPVCGEDNNTYDNSCKAEKANVGYVLGEC